jgi:hypothetical protein
MPIVDVVPLSPGDTVDRANLLALGERFCGDDAVSVNR